MFWCSNWFQNQIQGNHQNLGSTKRNLSRKTFPHTLSRRWSLPTGGAWEKSLVGQDLTRAWRPWAPMPQPRQSGPDMVPFSGEPKYLSQRMSTIENAVSGCSLQWGLESSHAFRYFKRERENLSHSNVVVGTVGRTRYRPPAGWLWTQGCPLMWSGSATKENGC